MPATVTCDDILNKKPTNIDGSDSGVSGNGGSGGGPGCVSFLLIGSVSSHGGVIITGNPMMLVGGVPVACVGDLHACPLFDGKSPHAVTPIVKNGCGSPRTKILGREAALSTDKTACGASFPICIDLAKASC